MFQVRLIRIDQEAARIREIMARWVKEEQKSNRPKQHWPKSSRKWRSREWLRLQESRVPFFPNEVLVVENDVEE